MPKLNKKSSKISVGNFVEVIRHNSDGAICSDLSIGTIHEVLVTHMTEEGVKMFRVGENMWFCTITHEGLSVHALDVIMKKVKK